ncbi:MAG: hypothetical protein FWF52_06520 [Candidatus Azobacteroides sp.]|nr:hypothetical protein [Candidatus Azobacteroides sp.]
MRTLNWCTFIAMLFFTFTAMAQDDSFGDDVYSSAKSKKSKPKTENVKPAQTERETPVVIATMPSDRDIDEYNRRYVNTNDYIDEIAADSLEYREGEATQRIVKFHDPSKITIVGADNVNINYDGETYEIDFDEPNNDALSINAYGSRYGYPYYAYSPWADPWYFRGWYNPWYYSWYGGWYDPWWYGSIGYGAWYGSWYYSWYTPWYYGGYYGGNRHSHSHYYEGTHYNRSSDYSTRSSSARDRSSIYNSSGRSYSSRDYGDGSSRSSSARNPEAVRGSNGDYSSGRQNARTRASEGSSYESGQGSRSSSARSGSDSYSVPSGGRSNSGSSGSYNGGGNSRSSGGGGYSSGSSGGGGRSYGGGGGGGSYGGGRSSGGGRR